MKHLSKYLIDRIIIDFENIDIDEVRGLLREEDSQESRALLSKLVEDHGLDDLAVTVADCLKAHIRTGIDEACVEEQLVMFSES